MGLLALGTPLAWQDAEKFADHVREHGITQFLHIWDKLKGRVGDGLLWGDEVGSKRASLELSPMREDGRKQPKIEDCPERLIRLTRAS